MKSMKAGVDEPLFGPLNPRTQCLSLCWVMAAALMLVRSPLAHSTVDPVAELQKKWTNPCAKRVEDFTRQLGQLVVSLDRMPSYSTEIGWEAVQQISDLTLDQQNVFCDALDSPAGRALDMDALVGDFGSRSSGPGCIGVSTYYGILGLKTVLDIIEEGLQAFCDGSSCPSSFPPEPPTCGIACAIVPPFGIAAEIISTRMDISDNCRFADHYDLMESMRDASADIIDSASDGLDDAADGANAARQRAVQADAFSDAFRGIGPAFDGDGFRGSDGNPDSRAPIQSSGIGPALEGLQDIVSAGGIEQQQFERRALRARLENALLTGATYSRMLRPRAFDGVLEEIRELVAQRIQAVSAAGGDTSVALQQFRNGDTAFNKADYRAALAGYRGAYEALGGARRPAQVASGDFKGDS